MIYHEGCIRFYLYHPRNLSTQQQLIYGLTLFRCATEGAPGAHGPSDKPRALRCLQHLQPGPIASGDIIPSNSHLPTLQGRNKWRVTRNNTLE